MRRLDCRGSHAKDRCAGVCGLLQRLRQLVGVMVLVSPNYQADRSGRKQKLLVSPDYLAGRCRIPM